MTKGPGFGYTESCWHSAFVDFKNLYKKGDSLRNVDQIPPKANPQGRNLTNPPTPNIKGDLIGLNAPEPVSVAN